ncbi:hypothetical protein L3Q82_020659, partial [Scortum barcoo]
MRGLCYFFLSVVAQVSSSTFKVIGLFGHNVTLPCRYDARAHGVLSFCWGREKVPMLKCSNTILSSQDGAVELRRSPRYQLLGRVADGDVSLTILNAQWDDASVYGCRVEIPGWFNDLKVDTHLVMEEAPVEQPVTLTTDRTQGCVCVESLIATVGSDVTLTCTYDALTRGRPPACWGRGALSYWDCSDEVIKTDGTAVTSRLSNRYLLLGDLAKGDVSLTIRQVEESDSGMYGCRVEIPGWFNDHRHEVILTVVPAPPNPLMIETREVKERTITVGWSPVFDGGRPITSYRIYLKHTLASWDTAVISEVSNPDLTRLTLVDLRPAKTYRLRMFAINSVGRSNPSNVLTVTTKEAAPEGPPLDMQLEALTSNSIKVTWKPPSGDLRNGVLQSYSISYREYDPAGRQFKRWQRQNVMATRELESVVLSRLKPSTIYSVHVQASTNAGVGPASTNLCSTLDEGCASAESVIATVGSDVTLTCKYDAQHYGRLSACWGRGAIPSRGCANEVIKSDGTSVTSRLSERYLFRGNIGEGDVSLTIRQVEESDSGMYGCRVEIPGWFNDHKHHLTLTVVAARPNPLKVETREVKERTITVVWTPVFNGGRPITTYRIDLKTKQASWPTALITEVSDPDLTRLTLVDLRPAKTYNLRMFAINTVGISEPSNVLTITMKEAAPEGPPLDMQLEALTSNSIKVTWKPPRLDLRNGVLRAYTISYREYNSSSRQFQRWQQLSVTATGEIESAVLSNLKPSTKYGVIIQAKTNAGIGPAANAPLCSTLDDASTAKPVTIATTWRDSSTSITSASWDYTNTVVDFSPNQTEATIIEINPSTYNIRMFARNSHSTSKASNILTITTGETG